MILTKAEPTYERYIITAIVSIAPGADSHFQCPSEVILEEYGDLRRERRHVRAARKLGGATNFFWKKKQLWQVHARDRVGKKRAQLTSERLRVPDTCGIVSIETPMVPKYCILRLPMLENTGERTRSAILRSLWRSASG